jgi:hypothetical protein
MIQKQSNYEIVVSDNIEKQLTVKSTMLSLLSDVLSANLYVKLSQNGE